MCWAAKDSNDQLGGTSAQWATLGVLAKLSNEAVSMKLSEKQASIQLVANRATVTKTMTPNTPHAGITRARYNAQ